MSANKVTEATLVAVLFLFAIFGFVALVVELVGTPYDELQEPPVGHMHVNKWRDGQERVD